MPINELRSIATFAKTAELGSLRRAAAAQGMTPQAASQALAQLEQHLGVRLFHRTTRNLSLTDEGRQFLEAAQPALIGLQRALEMARQAKDGIAGPLRIVGPRSTFLPVLTPVLAEFCRTHPEVQPDVQLDDRLGNWVEDRVDVGFRAGSSADEGVIARRLFTVQMIVCAAPAYIERHGAPQQLEALASHRCSAFRHPVTRKLTPWYLKVEGGIVEREVVGAICSNVEEVEMEVVLAGEAIAQVSSVSAAGHIRSGRLVPLFTAHVADQMGLYVYYGSRAAQPARVRAFIDLAIRRLLNNPEYELGAEELAAAEARGRQLQRRQ